MESQDLLPPFETKPAGAGPDMLASITPAGAAVAKPDMLASIEPKAQSTAAKAEAKKNGWDAKRLYALALNPWVILGSLAGGFLFGSIAPQQAIQLGFLGDIYVDLLKMITLPFMVSAICVSQSSAPLRASSAMRKASSVPKKTRLPITETPRLERLISLGLVRFWSRR